MHHVPGTRQDFWALPFLFSVVSSSPSSSSSRFRRINERALPCLPLFLSFLPSFLPAYRYVSSLNLYLRCVLPSLPHFFLTFFRSPLRPSFPPFVPSCLPWYCASAKASSRPTHNSCSAYLVYTSILLVDTTPGGNFRTVGYITALNISVGVVPVMGWWCGKGYSEYVEYVDEYCTIS